MTEKEIIIEARLRTDPEFLEKCILLLYEKQTKDEQAVGGTIEENGVGFNKADGSILGHMAEYLKEGKPVKLQFAIKDARQRMLKYVKQLSNYLTDEDLD